MTLTKWLRAINLILAVIGTFLAGLMWMEGELARTVLLMSIALLNAVAFATAGR